MPPTITPLNWRQHSRDVLDFQREIYELNFPGFLADRQFIREYADHLRRAVGKPDEGVFVLEVDRRARGFLWVALISTMVEPCVGYIKNIYVAPELRSHGYGRQLMQFAEAWCIRKGVSRITLDASCCNQRAVGIYREAGYEVVRLRMEKHLHPSDLAAVEQELAAPALAEGAAAAW